MRYLSVCSGIEAATVAWHPLGWTPVAFSEIERFPSAVLAHHYPDVPNFGDMTAYKEWIIPDGYNYPNQHAGRQGPSNNKRGGFRDLGGRRPNARHCPGSDTSTGSICGSVDLVVGGTPCQSFSVAGLRRGLDDPRGNLALVFLGLVDRFRPRWVVWENVPGVRSADDGGALGAFLGGLAELGYGWAYRSLDAQYFGLAQRRERVFVVGYSGDWRPPVAVLFEPESMRGDSAPRREAGERVAPTVEGRAGRSGETGFHTSGGLVQVAPAVTGGPPYSLTGNERVEADALVTHALRADGFDAGEDGTGRGTPLVVDLQQVTSKANRSRPTPESPPLTPGGTVVALDDQGRSVINVRDDGSSPTLRSEAHGNIPAVVSAVAVRRLTPRECERLQGFPDDYTAITYRRKPAADGPRYKALGNSMAVPVMRWIGERIALVESALAARDREAAA